MSKKSWESSWGKVVPLLHTKTENLNQHRILDQKVFYALSQILKSGADVNDTSPNVQCTILHLCLGKGLIRSSKFLIKNGAYTQKTNLFNETPYQYIQYAPFNKEELYQWFCTLTSLPHKKTR